MHFDILSNCEGCLIRPPLRLSPTPNYRKFATALVKLQLSVNRLLTG